MNITLPLEQMTATDKLLTMELLWADLCQDSDNITSPDWHGDVLASREKAVREGTEGISDWGDAKRDIRLECGRTTVTV